MSIVLRSWLPVRITALLFASVLLASCGEPAAPPASDPQPNTAAHARVNIGTSGYTIELLNGYFIAQDETFGTYYFKPVNKDGNESEAGFYIGPRPDTTSPLSEYTKITFKDVFLGDTATWIEYTTAKYQQREVFIERSPEEKIHAFCYSRNRDEVEKLFGMMKTIR